MLMGIKSTYSLILLILIVIIFMLSCTNFTKNKYVYIFGVTFLLSLLGSFFNPIVAYKNGDYTDLVRFFQTMDAIKGAEFNNKILIFQEYNNIPVMKVLLYMVSKTGIKSLLPFLSSFIFYGSFGYFIAKISEKYKVSNRVMGLSYFAFICLFNFKMVITNIRCPIGDAIFMLTLYYDFFAKNKKKGYLIGYFVCCAIHPIFILFTLLRVILIISNKVTSKLFYLLILAYSLFINYALDFVGKLTNIELFNYLSTKMDYYTNFWNTKSNEPLILLTGIIQIIVLIYFLFISKKSIDEKSQEKKFYNITVAFVILAIGSSWNFVTFQRCTWLLIFFIIYWFIYLKSLKDSKANLSLAIYDFVMIILILFSLGSYFFTYQYNVLTF